MEMSTLDEFVNDATRYVSDTADQIVDLLPDRNSNLGKIGSAAAGAVLEGLGGRFMRPVKTVGKIAKGAGKLILPQTGLEGKGEMMSIMPEIDPNIRERNEEIQRQRDRQKAAQSIADTEARITEDNLKPARKRALGDGDPMTNLNREMERIFSDPNMGA
jgi:hypothetical protein